MADQSSFRFTSLRGEVLNLGRIGLELDWKRIERTARREFQAQLAQLTVAAACELLSAGFDSQRYFYESALLAEIRRQSNRKAKEIRENKGERVVAFFRSPEGRRVQIVMDRLIERLGDWEAVSLCG